ncbi:hypothetical protein RRG08_012043 [Elysia crispata]|uniref:Uncharacterized protein n=1 Tax=Elysia crispata TaxID=231223 RepID=A0AAE0XV62_9GAST|nr:hypothetical protein RRG08_012043 [Elysia crispata]
MAEEIIVMLSENRRRHFSPSRLQPELTQIPPHPRQDSQGPPRQTDQSDAADQFVKLTAGVVGPRPET